MTIQVLCDKCGAAASPVWGEVTYSPAGGRHGSETWHFCFDCVPALRDFVMQNVPRIPLETGGVAFIGHGWMLRQDYIKFAATQEP